MVLETTALPLSYPDKLDQEAFVLNLLIAQMLSLKRAQQTIHTLIGLAIYA